MNLKRQTIDRLQNSGINISELPPDRDRFSVQWNAGTFAKPHPVVVKVDCPLGSGDFWINKFLDGLP